MTESLHADFRQLDCKADFWSLRMVDERAESDDGRRHGGRQIHDVGSDDLSLHISYRDGFWHAREEMGA